VPPSLFSAIKYFSWPISVMPRTRYIAALKVHIDAPSLPFSLILMLFLLQSALCMRLLEHFVHFSSET